MLPSACVRNILTLCFTSNTSFILCTNSRTLHACLPLTNGWQHNRLSEKTTPSRLIFSYRSAVWRCLWATANSDGPFYSTPDDEWIWTTKGLVITINLEQKCPGVELRFPWWETGDQQPQMCYRPLIKTTKRLIYILLHIPSHRLYLNVSIQIS